MLNSSNEIAKEDFFKKEILDKENQREKKRQKTRVSQMFQFYKKADIGCQ